VCATPNELVIYAMTRAIGSNRSLQPRTCAAELGTRPACDGHRRPRALLLALSVAFIALRCVRAEQPPGYPLYPNAGARLPREQVAQLTSSMPGGSAVGAGSLAFIKAIDGRDVSTLDTAFELLQGCHIVETASRLLITNEVMTWHGDIGMRTFAFRMRAGHSYTVKVELVQSMGSSGRVLLFGVEQNSTGTETERIEVAKSAADLQACQAWGAKLAAAPLVPLVPLPP
jgi:hypothetical protein